MKKVFLIQNPENEEFFSSFYYSGEVSTIPVLFGAKEWKNKEDAFSFKDSDARLKDFIVVSRTSKITIKQINPDEKELQDHELRVVDEQQELQIKLDSLGVFLKKGKPDFIDDTAWSLLEKQYEHMIDYNKILKLRIEMFK